MKKRLEPLQPVLVRNKSTDVWAISLFSHYVDGGAYVCVNGVQFDECIPLKEHSHLVGTRDKPKDK